MLENINNYTYKSFKNYTGPLSTEKFKRVNMIFGYNGKGKTALAKGIIEEFLKDPSNSENNYRFYDKDYIKNNINNRITITSSTIMTTTTRTTRA